jgi:hypothetical protein
LKLHDLGFELAVARFEFPAAGLEFSLTCFVLSDLPVLLGDEVKELLAGRLGYPGRSRPPCPTSPAGDDRQVSASVGLQVL